MRHSFFFYLALPLIASAALAAEGVSGPMEPGPGTDYPRGLEQGTEVEQPASVKSLGVHYKTDGTVTRVNHDSGMINLRTATSDLQLIFPKADINDVRVGDRISADLALWQGSHDQSRRKVSGDVPIQPKFPSNEHTFNGKVNRIDHARGALGVATTDGQLQLEFPPEALQSLRDGDQVTIEMAFVSRTTGDRTAK